MTSSDYTMDILFDQFSEGNYAKLDELGDKITIEQRHELAQLMVALADVTDKTRSLMEWVYVTEVSAAANSMMIFKTDPSMMSSIIGSYLCYSYSCVRWLKFITVPLVEYLESQTCQASSTTPDGAQVLMKASEIALNNFFSTTLDVPLWLRQACMAYQLASDKKFGTVKGNPRPPGLLCGYLVSVLTTEKNAVIGDVSTKTKNGLRSVAALLLQLGYQFGSINNPILQQFISNTTPQLVAYYDEFVCAEAIQMAEEVLASSRPRVFAKDIRMRTKRQRFAKMMLKFNASTSSEESSSHHSTDSPEISELVSATDSLLLIQKMDHDGWRRSKSTKPGVKISTWRSDDSHTVSLKVELRVESTLLDASNAFSTKVCDPEFDPIITRSARERISENVHHIYGHSDLPWPLGTRTFAFYQGEVLDKNKNQVVFVHKHAPYPIPKKSGMVESKMYLSGTRLTVDHRENNFVNVTVVIHSDPGGLIPHWFVNRVVTDQATKIIKLAKFLEERSAKAKQSTSSPRARKV